MTAVTIAAVQQTTARVFGVEVLDLKSSRRSAKIARPRQVAMYLSRNLTTHSLPEIGRAFGGRDHTTVMHALQRIDDLMARDPRLRVLVERVRNRMSVEKVNKELAAIEDQLAMRAGEIVILEREVDRLRAEVMAKDSEITMLRAGRRRQPKPKERLCSKCHTNVIVSAYPGLCDSCRKENEKMGWAEGYPA